MRIVHVVGARPNFIKLAPVMRALGKMTGMHQVLIHTGQHYDQRLSEDFFADLELPPADYNLSVGSASHAVQTGRIMIALEPVLKRLSPDWVYTVSDSNSALAATLVAAKLGIRVAHVEAGLRCHEWSSPEEINRTLTDHMSAILFTSEASAEDNLRCEGIARDRVRPVGSVLIDTLDRYRGRAAKLAAHRAMGLDDGRYTLVTMHRPFNVDEPARLARVLDALAQVAYACDCPVVLVLHPRTAKNIKTFGLEGRLAGLRVLGPLRYLEFLSLMDHAGLVLTDSGGVQEETTVLGVPCITLRPSTDRPLTVTEGTNRVFNGDLNELADPAREAMAEKRHPRRPVQWDGHAAERIAEIALQASSGSARPDAATRTEHEAAPGRSPDPALAAAD